MRVLKVKSRVVKEFEGGEGKIEGGKGIIEGGKGKIEAGKGKVEGGEGKIEGFTDAMMKKKHSKQINSSLCGKKTPHIMFVLT